MTQLDLGNLTGTLLLFGGPYSNLQAIQALRRRAEELHIDPANIICTGDSIAYCAQPNETLELLRQWGITLLMGNCEQSLASDSNDCGCGFEAGSTCDALADSWYRYSVKTVSQSHKQWMRNLPQIIRFTYQHKTFAVVHGSAAQMNQFIFPSTDERIKFQQIKLVQADGIIAGHSGLPFTQVIDDKLWHNPGVIGMPANEGNASVWYSLWHPAGNQIQIEHHRLQYDAMAAKQYMLAAGLNNGYAEALLSGLWPSMDVLPDKERGQQGKAIPESEVLF
jgi:predicted phosphodiesterase